MCYHLSYNIKMSFWKNPFNTPSSIKNAVDSSSNNFETNNRKLILLYLGIFMSAGGLFWGALLWPLGVGELSIIPFSYIVITAVNFILLRYLSNVNLSVFIQLFISLLLPFALQWGLGGFFASGVMMLWAILGLMGAIILTPSRQSSYWLMFFLMLLGISFYIDDLLTPISLSYEKSSIVMMTASITLITIITFFLGRLKVENDKETRKEIIAKNEIINNALTELEQKKESLEKSNEDLKKFSYISSHDLKAPIRGIASLSRFIQDDTESTFSDEAKGYLTALDNRVKRLGLLLEGILSYTEIDTTPKKEIISTTKLFSDIIQSFNEKAIFEIKDNLPDLYANRQQLTLVVKHIVENAIKFCDKAPVQIKIESQSNEHGHTIFVSDNGPGIDNTQHEKIFDIFKTINPRDEVESTGMGLALVKKIIELHNGQVGLTSKVGEGSTFFFTLPNK